MTDLPTLIAQLRAAAEDATKGEWRAGLEKAAATMKRLHGGGEADNPHDSGWQAACVAGERAIRSLKGRPA
jgi:hypothetical protein